MRADCSPRPDVALVGTGKVHRRSPRTDLRGLSCACRYTRINLSSLGR
jgi:hypothetical protein